MSQGSADKICMVAPSLDPRDFADIVWLKSLRPQSRWKPSDEQMKALKYAIKRWENGQGVACPSSFKYYLITDLYNDLKKLKEE